MFSADNLATSKSSLLLELFQLCTRQQKISVVAVFEGSGFLVLHSFWVFRGTWTRYLDG